MSDKLSTQHPPCDYRSIRCVRACELSEAGEQCIGRGRSSVYGETLQRADRMGSFGGVRPFEAEHAHLEVR